MQDPGKYQSANFVGTNQLANETYYKVHCILYYLKIVHLKNKFTHTHTCIFFPELVIKHISEYHCLGDKFVTE